MPKILYFFLLTILSCQSNVHTVSNTDELLTALQSPSATKIIHLQSGTYNLSPIAVTDSSCGNCQDSSEMVPATAGLVLSGEKIHLSGPADQSARIITNAGYGIFFLNCADGMLKNLRITGGQRDMDGRASDAAIVAKNSKVLIENNIIYDNIGDSALVVQNIVGIMGICGRENAQLTIRDNRIIRNSWDGIALYRDADAVITGNLVDGVDKAGSKTAGGGRGVSIGITWNARAEVRGNIVKNYWKGIGVFVDGSAVIENNIIEDLLTWGIAYWDAGKGQPTAKILNNIVYNTGACGVNLSAKNSTTTENQFTGNVVVKTAQNPKYDAADYYGYQCALSIFDVPKGFVNRNNLFYANRRADESLPDYDVNTKIFSDSLNHYMDGFQNKYRAESSFFDKYLKEKTLHQ